MARFVVFAPLLLAVTLACGQAGAQALNPDMVKLCEAKADNTRIIAEARQRGLPLSAVLKIFESDANANENTRRIDQRSQLETLRIFEDPLYSSDDLKERAVADFIERSMLQCIQCFQERPEDPECFFAPVR